MIIEKANHDTSEAVSDNCTLSGLRCPECGSVNVVPFKNVAAAIKLVVEDDEYICKDCLFDFKVPV
ncbi:MAG: hypothetical protein HPY66_2937 [Firmicutes bacterium]|nr:hypothetical protein [Bacillota bacterium]